jgi:hypothetical protein
LADPGLNHDRPTDWVSPGWANGGFRSLGKLLLGLDIFLARRAGPRAHRHGLALYYLGYVLDAWPDIFLARRAGPRAHRHGLALYYLGYVLDAWPDWVRLAQFNCRMCRFRAALPIRASRPPRRRPPRAS